MKGENELIVSQATLVEMIQFYVDHKIPNLGAVDQVRQHDAVSHEFRIMLKAREEIPWTDPHADPRAHGDTPRAGAYVLVPPDWKPGDPLPGYLPGQDPSQAQAADLSEASFRDDAFSGRNLTVTKRRMP